MEKYCRSGQATDDNVAARRYNNNEDLRRAVEDAFRTITPKMLRHILQRTWRRISLCVQHQGAHTDSLDM